MPTVQTIYLTTTTPHVTGEVLERYAGAYRIALDRFCDLYDLEVPTLIVEPERTKVPEGAEVIVFAGKPPMGEDGVLGEHWLEHGRARGMVYAEYELENGGGIYEAGAPGTTSVAAVGLHELLELLVDPTINVWWDGPVVAHNRSYAMVAGEVCDPVEGPHQKIDGIDLCNYVTPAWFNIDAKEAGITYFDAIGQLHAPFSMLPEGYLVVRDAPGKEHEVFGEHMPEHRRKLKAWSWARRRALAAKAHEPAVAEQSEPLALAERPRRRSREEMVASSRLFHETPLDFTPPPREESVAVADADEAPAAAEEVEVALDFTPMYADSQHLLGVRLKNVDEWKERLREAGELASEAPTEAPPPPPSEPKPHDYRGLVFRARKIPGGTTKTITIAIPWDATAQSLVLGREAGKHFSVVKLTIGDHVLINDELGDGTDPLERIGFSPLDVDADSAATIEVRNLRYTPEDFEASLVMRLR